MSLKLFAKKAMREQLKGVFKKATTKSEPKGVYGESTSDSSNAQNASTSSSYENTGLLKKTEDVDNAKQEALNTTKKRKVVYSNNGGANIDSSQGQIFLG